MDAMHTQDLSKMVAVACGTRVQVQLWSEALRKAAIDFLMAEGVETPSADAEARVEVWVLLVDADDARASLRRCRRDGDLVLW